MASPIEVGDSQQPASDDDEVDTPATIVDDDDDLHPAVAADDSAQPPRPVQELTWGQFADITRGLSSLSASSATLLRTAAPREERSRSPHRNDGGQRYIMFDCRVVELLRQMRNSECRNVLMRALHNQAHGVHGRFGLTDLQLDDVAHTRFHWHLEPMPAAEPRNCVALVSAQDSVAGGGAAAAPPAPAEGPLRCGGGVSAAVGSLMEEQA